MEIRIRKENENDYKTIYDLVKLAFQNEPHSDGDEQDLVEKLRTGDSYIPELSLVAECNGEIVGHIMFTKAKIEENVVLVLAPLAIIPEYQRKGIGGKLIEEGHKIAKNMGYTAIFLTGHSEYYPKFGYERASEYGISLSIEVPDNCFLVHELKKDSLNNLKGVLKFAKEFGID